MASLKKQHVPAGVTQTVDCYDGHHVGQALICSLFVTDVVLQIAVFQLDDEIAALVTCIVNTAGPDWLTNTSFYASICTFWCTALNWVDCCFTCQCYVCHSQAEPDDWL